MNLSQTELRRQVRTAKKNGWAAICTEAEQAAGLPAGILLAVASRETNVTDIVGDRGHGRGLFQIDDRSWKEWLAAQGAGGSGKTPPVAAAARLAASIIRDNRAFGRKNGVAEPDLAKFALSAYNAGAGGAIRGYREGDSDLHTTGADYGKDVLERLAAIAGGAAPDPKPAADDVLRVGSRGSRVTGLKERLRQWFDLNAPGEWETFKVGQGPLFDPKLKRAVRVFQERQGLLVDGEVGAQTLGVLGIAPAPAPAPAPSLPPDLTLDRVYRKGSGGVHVRLIQGWLCLGGFALAADGEFGPATLRQVKAFQKQKGLKPTGAVDEATYDALTAPMHAALRPLPPAASLGAMVVAYAKQHLAQHPHEVRLMPNDGPWVRLYTDGHEGDAFPWCAGFATFVLKQACETMDVRMPVARTLSCDEMAATAKASRIFLASPSTAERKRITPGSMFLRRAVSGGLAYAHTGIVTEAGADTFASIEGNTNDGGSFEGIEVIDRVRSYDRMDFVLIR